MNSPWTGFKTDPETFEEFKEDDIIIDISDKVRFGDSSRSFAPFVASGSDTIVEGELLRTNGSYYVDISPFVVRNHSLTFLVWARPSWASDDKVVETNTVFGFTDTGGDGFFLSADDSTPYEWVLSTKTISSSSNYPHEEDELLFFAVTIDASRNAIGYSYIGDTTNIKESILSKSPTAYWRLGERDGTLAVDSANSNDLLFDGVTLGESPAIANDNNTSISIESGEVGSDSFISDLNPNGSFSIAAWAKPTGGTGTARTVASSSDSNTGYILRATTGNKWEFSVGNSTTHVLATSGSNIANDEWYFLVGTYTAGTLKLYVNGVEVDSDSVTLAANSTANFKIGALNDSTAKFVGNIDEVAFFPSTLTQNEVQDIYDAGRQSRLSHSDSESLDDITPTKIHLGGNGSSDIFDGSINKIYVLYKTLTSDEIEEIAEEGWQNQHEPFIAIDFDQMSAKINSVSIYTPLSASDTLTVTEDDPVIKKVVWEKTFVM